MGLVQLRKKKCKVLGIYSGEDLLAWSLDELKPIFGKASHYYYNVVRGVDGREVESHRERKSIGSEKTFSEDLTHPAELLEKLQQLATEVWQREASKRCHREKPLRLKSNLTILYKSHAQKQSVAI